MTGTICSTISSFLPCLTLWRVPSLPPAGAAAAALAPTDKAHTIRQLGMGTPANHLLGLLCTEGDARRSASKEPSPKEEPQE